MYCPPVSIVSRVRAKGPNPEEIGACATDFLNFSSYVLLAYGWLRMALTAQKKLDDGSGDSAFYEAKLASSRFYFERILPRAELHRQVLQSSADNLFGLTAEQFVRQ